MIFTGIVITTSKKLKKRSEMERACIEENMKLRAENEYLKHICNEFKQKNEYLLEIVKNH